ncbi:hypothetical protein SDC9_204169 [bioreactor metagenome]|uniref:Uncharacterized protein n=1 Tax=bioreactor metagenome TaxID=1076179 RepID=A0A645J194_9ZZZZ
MCGEHACSKKTCINIIAQQIIAYRIANQQRNDKRVKSKGEALVPVLHKFTQIELQPDYEHDVKQADG